MCRILNIYGMERPTSQRVITALISFGVAFFLGQQVAQSGLPETGTYKIAYYVFDSGGPDHYPLTTFTDLANVVVIFEGTLWELADSAHYSTGWMRNVNYHSYAEILRDIRVLQARGVKVLMNVDDAASWSTSTPFTTYDGKILSAPEFAAFMKTCAIDSVHLDGISLDIEHKATGNADYISLIEEIGKYFGPLSANSTTQIYTAAIYTGGAPGPVIGKSPAIAAYLNFIMDMAYFKMDYATRFNQWADSIGASKTMIGVLNDYYTTSYAMSAAAWLPAHPPKAGIMVYAANNRKSYTDSVFSALIAPPGVAVDPRPADSTVTLGTALELTWKLGSGATSHDVYFGTTNPPESKGNQTDTVYMPGTLAENTTYFWRIDERNVAGVTTGPVWSFTTGSANAIAVERSGTPEETTLMQNYPNPFNPSTIISGQLTADSRQPTADSRVRLIVYDVLGRVVAVLADGRYPAGKFSFTFDGTKCASGVYFYRLTVGNFTAVRKMTLVK